MVAFPAQLGRDTGISVVFSDPGTPTTINLPVANTPVAVTNLGDPLGQAVDIEYNKTTGVYTMLAAGPLLIQAVAHLASTVALARVELRIQKLISSVWTTVGPVGVRVISTTTNICGLRANYRTDYVQCKDPDVSNKPGSQFRLAFVSSQAADDAIVSSYIFEITRPAGNRSLAS